MAWYWWLLTGFCVGFLLCALLSVNKIGGEE